MTRKPRLPDDYDIPEGGGEWSHNPESTKNGHIWESPSGDAVVGVFGGSIFDQVRVEVIDERVKGFARSNDIERIEIRDGDEEEEVVVEGIETAVRWMETTDAREWEHSEVNTAAFDAPVGYELEHYFLEEQQTTIYYRREETPDKTKGFVDDDDPGIRDYNYLVVQVWRGNGNATVAVAPWTRAHDDEMWRVREPPEECGLDIALKEARDFARRQMDVGEGVERPPKAGQTGLSEGWSA